MRAAAPSVAQRTNCTSLSGAAEPFANLIACANQTGREGPAPSSHHFRSRSIACPLEQSRNIFRTNDHEGSSVRVSVPMLLCLQMHACATLYKRYPSEERALDER